MITKLSFLTITSLLLFSSCATQHHSMKNLRTYSYPHLFISDTVTLSYFTGVLQQSGNDRSARWARRKNLHFIGVKLLNNSKQKIQGFQLEFCNGDRTLELVSNQWAARKVRQRTSAVPFISAITGMIEGLVYHSILQKDDDEPIYSLKNNQSYGTFSGAAYENDTRTRTTANSDLLKELSEFNIYKRILYPGEPVYGILVIKAHMPPYKLRVKVIEEDDLDSRPKSIGEQLNLFSQPKFHR